MAQPAGSHLRRRALGLLGVLLAASIALLGCSGGGAVAPQTPPPAAAEPLALEIIVRTPAMLRTRPMCRPWWPLRAAKA
jgi:hypothetical protein